MTRRFVLASVVLFVTTVLNAAPIGKTPDFWYVVPDAAHADPSNRVVNGIVIPSTVDPSIEASPGGSVISWQRVDGTRQSFAVRGADSLAFKPGPLKGTIYVPFGRKAKGMQRIWGMCCSCASWINSEESFSAQRCVDGCQGCGCEGCICSNDANCPTSPVAAWTLVAHDDPSQVLTIAESGKTTELVLGETKLRGSRLSAKVNEAGETEIENPDTIELSGKVEFSSAVRGDNAIFAYSTPGLSVIVEQPRSIMPSFHDGTIDLRMRPAGSPEREAVRMAPVQFICTICGTHPHSDVDLEAMECIPGDGTCFRCLSFGCLAPKS